MAVPVMLLELSHTIKEGELTRWLKKEGDRVAIGEPLAWIETSKATVELPALASGVLRRVLIQEGESAPLGQIIAIIGGPNEDISQLLADAQLQPRPTRKVSRSWWQFLTSKK
jgi:pyruvate dehydrogenase E2 component (dihydrolipoamide acetyltransferase)